MAKKEKEYKFTYVFMHVNKCVCVSVCVHHVKQFPFFPPILQMGILSLRSET